MDLETYIELTGLTPANETQLQAMLTKSQSILESLLGFTLDPSKVEQNLYNESGKSPNECSCSSVASESLLDPDEVVFAYRLYDYNDKDVVLRLDPFEEVYKVKLVKDDVTIRTLDSDEYRVIYGKDGLARSIEVCKTCFCTCDCSGCVQLAVDAKWLWSEELPADLQYVWADMATYYADNKRDIKSQTVGPHSWTKFANTPPQDLEANIAILKRYGGPNGSLNRIPVI